MSRRRNRIFLMSRACCVWRSPWWAPRAVGGDKCLQHAAATIPDKAHWSAIADLAAATVLTVTTAAVSHVGLLPAQGGLADDLASDRQVFRMTGPTHTAASRLYSWRFPRFL